MKALLNDLVVIFAILANPLPLFLFFFLIFNLFFFLNFIFKSVFEQKFKLDSILSVIFFFIYDYFEFQPISDYFLL